MNKKHNQNEWNLNLNQNNGLKRQENAVLIGIILPDQSTQIIKEYLDELQFLALTAGAKTLKRFTQKLKHPNPKTFVGAGKLEEIKNYIIAHEEITMVIFDDDLTGKQTNILERELGVKIVDRSSLILDIFATRAQTAQAKTQVELAQMQYLLPRLRGLWTHLTRQRGGIGMRGPGEKEIETDRRIVRDKITLLKKKLEKIDRQNLTQNKQRDQLIRVALVGYTNAGKSTLMNLLSKSQVFAENKLFATLDTTVRKVTIDTTFFLLSDTVGFIRKLPTHLIESFKTTLDEAKNADILLHIVDIAHPQFEDHILTVNTTLAQLKAQEKPTLLVCNKIDEYKKNSFDSLVDETTQQQILAQLKQSLKTQYNLPIHFISAKNNENTNTLRNQLIQIVRQQYNTKYPYHDRSHYR